LPGCRTTAQNVPAPWDFGPRAGYLARSTAPRPGRTARPGGGVRFARAARAGRVGWRLMASLNGELRLATSGSRPVCNRAESGSLVGQRDGQGCTSTGWKGSYRGRSGPCQRGCPADPVSRGRRGPGHSHAPTNPRVRRAVEGELGHGLGHKTVRNRPETDQHRGAGGIKVAGQGHTDQQSPKPWTARVSLRGYCPPGLSVQVPPPTRQQSAGQEGVARRSGLSSSPRHRHEGRRR
jgi:hypothetical protein